MFGSSSSKLNQSFEPAYSPLTKKTIYVRDCTKDNMAVTQGHENSTSNPLQSSLVLVQISSCFVQTGKGVKMGKNAGCIQRQHSHGNPHQFSLKPLPILLSLSPVQPLPPYSLSSFLAIFVTNADICVRGGVWSLVGYSTSLYQARIKSSVLILGWVTVWVN